MGGGKGRATRRCCGPALPHSLVALGICQLTSKPAPCAPADDDVVLGSFRQSQQQYQQLMQGLQVRPRRPSPACVGKDSWSGQWSMDVIDTSLQQGLCWHWNSNGCKNCRPGAAPLAAQTLSRLATGARATHACHRLCPCPCCLQNINLPLTGDDAAVKKYAAEVEALKAKIGMPDVEEVRPTAGGRGLQAAGQG